MRLGIEIGLRGLSPAETEEFTSSCVIDQVRRAEDAGFRSVWVSDSIGRGTMTLDPLAVLTVAAAATSSLEVGTAVYQVPLREPVELAHRVLSAYALSKGRLRFGVGAGSSPEDFAAAGRDYNCRFQTLHENIAEMKKLWKGEKRNGAVLVPHRGVIGGPPVLLGSWGKAESVTRAARQYDGWIASAWPRSRPRGPAESPATSTQDAWNRLESGMAAFRRAGGRRAVVANVLIGPSDDPLASGGGLGAFGTAGDIERSLRRLEELGFDDAVVRARGSLALELAGCVSSSWKGEPQEVRF